MDFNVPVRHGDTDKNGSISIGSNNSRSTVDSEAESKKGCNITISQVQSDKHVPVEDATLATSITSNSSLPIVVNSNDDPPEQIIKVDLSFNSFESSEVDENGIDLDRDTKCSNSDSESVVSSSSLDNDDKKRSNRRLFQKGEEQTGGTTGINNDNHDINNSNIAYNPLHQPAIMKKRKRPLFSALSSLDANYSSDKNNNSDNSSSRDNSNNEPVVVLGADISHLSGPWQFVVCASGVFGFNLSFGYLQEFVSVEICNRNLGLFLAMLQFTGYTGLSYLLRNYVNKKSVTAIVTDTAAMATSLSSSTVIQHHQNNTSSHNKQFYPPVPAHMYIGLGVLSAIDMAMTNMAMLYINYPAKTLMKSSRVVFTMIFGVLLAGKRYRLLDYLIVLCMVAGLAIFMQADATSNAIFEPLGVVMLTISLLCDGATNIMSETIMKTYGVGQDELIFRMYSLALLSVIAAALFNGDLHLGLLWLMKPGTYDEWNDAVPNDEITWNVTGKITMIVLFSSMGFFGSSCSAAIIKNFGALTMSMTSTARRATTLFISFFLFENECTYQHIVGVIIFITSLTTKSFLSRTKSSSKIKSPLSPPPVSALQDLETQ